MSVAKKWDGGTIVELSPVLQQGKNPENAEFWKYTPSGDATLTFKGPSFDDRGKEYSPGDYYYIEMHKDHENGGWCLSEISHTGEESGRVELCTNGKKTVGWGKDVLGFSYGKMTMGLDHAPALSWFDKAAENWDVQFTWAEPSDD
jgi:hypothetical protein